MNKRRKKIIKLMPLGSIRFKAIYVTSLILIMGLLSKLFYLQVLNASNLKNKALARQIKRTDFLSLVFEEMIKGFDDGRYQRGY